MQRADARARSILSQDMSGEELWMRVMKNALQLSFHDAFFRSHKSPGQVNKKGGQDSPPDFQAGISPYATSQRSVAS